MVKQVAFLFHVYIVDLVNARRRLLFLFEIQALFQEASVADAFCYLTFCGGNINSNVLISYRDADTMGTGIMKLGRREVKYSVSFSFYLEQCGLLFSVLMIDGHS